MRASRMDDESGILMRMYGLPGLEDYLPYSPPI
jgi:hypothetical protein